MEQLKISKSDASMVRVKELHKENPINPKIPFSNRVRQEVIYSLNLPENKEGNLKFYTTVSNSKNKTVLDRDLGIDFFIELERDKEEPVKVTVDITLKPYKQNPKADIIFSLPDDFPSHARFKKNQLAGLSDRRFAPYSLSTRDPASSVLRVRKT